MKDEPMSARTFNILFVCTGNSVRSILAEGLLNQMARCSPLDFVMTVCDQAAGETCPVWPGQPILAHWGAPDPAKAQGTEEEILTQFMRAASLLRHRIDLFLSLPLATLQRLALDQAVKQIGNTSP